MNDFFEITTGKNHPFGHVGKIHAKNYPDMIKIINDLKKNAGAVIEDISLTALEK